jgi:DNA-binding response OmpR family regulator
MAQPTVLVCEDESLIRHNISEHLRDSGFRVLEARDAAQAQSLFLSGETIDVLSTDVVMPGEMDGIGLAAWVRERYPTVRIIVVTAGHKNQHVAQRFDDFMLKPCMVEDIVERVRRLTPAGNFQAPVQVAPSRS